MVKNKMNFYGQFEQDKILYENIFKKQKTGFILDIGAMCGKRASNSLFFENMGWDGILVEASPKQINVLKNNRKWNIIEKAVVPNDYKKNKIEFLAFDQGEWGEGLSGILENYDYRHTQRINTEYNQGFIKKIPQTIMVDTIKVNKLLNICPNEIDFISLDIEGGELNILKSIDYNKTYIKAIVVENNYKDPNFNVCMNKNNFTQYKKVGCDEIYINNIFMNGM